MNIRITNIIPDYTCLFSDDKLIEQIFNYLEIKYDLTIGENIFLQGYYHYTNDLDYEKLNIDNFKKIIENEILKEFELAEKERYYEYIQR